MSTRFSGFAPVQHQHFPTPAWVVDALAEHVSLKHKTIWEPACGIGAMADALEARGATVSATDIHDHGYAKMHRQGDFLTGGNLSAFVHYQGIVTNPPYGAQGKTAEAFIRQGLKMTADYGFLALLLQVDFDSGITRRPLFRDCPQFFGKIVLTKRIKWFEPEGAQKSSTPSANHAWFIWQRTWAGERQTARILYAPNEDRAAA